MERCEPAMKALNRCIHRPSLRACEAIQVHQSDFWIASQARNDGKQARNDGKQACNDGKQACNDGKQARNDGKQARNDDAHLP